MPTMHKCFPVHVFFLFLFFYIITVTALLNAGCVVTSPHIGTQTFLSSISPTFFSDKSSAVQQTGQEPFWNYHMPHSVKRLVLSSFFPEERRRAHVAFSCLDKLNDYFTCLPQKSVALIPLSSLKD